jgi:ferredoxin
MEKLFSTNLLCTNKDGQNVLQSFLGKLRPGLPFSPENKDKIVLSGGFPSLTPETTFPLSPALQLNSNLTSLTEKELSSLAEAELSRNNSIDFRSYDVDVDLRVCVIAAKSRQLEQFLDTYGGILEIEPLLLNTNHPDFPTVTAVDIEELSQGYELSFTERSPVNKDLCTYCGECGAACPENCISSSLQVDFERCTFCKECEKVCGTNALDMYGVEEKKMRVPAVLILDGVSLDLPENRSGIYEEKQLESFFSTLFSSNIEEVVCHNNSTCQYSGRLGVGCSRCVVSCPHGAVSQDQSGVKVDHLRCEECGSCIAACPTGSMQYAKFNDQAWLEYLSLVKITQGTTIIIGAEKELHSLWWLKIGQKYDNVLFLEYPSIEALSGFHLLMLFALGAHRIALLHDGVLSESSPVSRQAAMTNYIVSSLFDVSCAAIVKTSECDDYLNSENQHSLQRFYGDFSYENRRFKLTDVIQFLVSASGRTIASSNVLKGLGHIDCDAVKCTHCLACLNDCSMQALGADEKSLSLTYSARRCVSCGVCVKVCPEDALTFAKDFTIDEQYFERKTAAQAEPAICKGCGKVFGTRKSLDRVIQILTAREAVDTEHFEYCDNCKVVKIFEAEQ